MAENNIKYIFYTEGKIDTPLFGGNPDELTSDIDLDFSNLHAGQEFSHKGTKYKVLKTHTWEDESPVAQNGMFVLCENVD